MSYLSSSLAFLVDLESCWMFSWSRQEADLRQRSLAIISAEHTFAFVIFVENFPGIRFTLLSLCLLYVWFDCLAAQGVTSTGLKGPGRDAASASMEVPQNGYQVRCFTIQCFNFYSLAFHFPSSWRHKLHDDTISKPLSAEEKGRGARGRGGQQKESLHNSYLYNNTDHNGQQTFSL